MSITFPETAATVEDLAGCHPGYSISDADPRFDEDHPTRCVTHGHSWPCRVATNLTNQLRDTQDQENQS